jgi:uncharacterized protein (DUF362 family)
MPKSKVVIRSTRKKALDAVVLDLLNALEWQSVVFPGAKVVIKLNLNTAEPSKIESANTSPVLVDALCRVMQSRTSEITLVEAHGYRYSAEEAFRAAGIYEIAERAGAKVVNLSLQPCRDVGNPMLGQLPEILLDADVFITMPVIKTHCLTYFTGALKNQWGCIPRYDRIALHHSLDRFLVKLQGILHPKLCIMDGIVGVEGRGPTNGKPRRLGIILGSSDAVALDSTAMRLVGLDSTKSRHVLMAHEAGLGKFYENEIELDSDIVPDWTSFEPAKLDWAVAWMNRWSKYAWFRRYILEVTSIFLLGKRIVGTLRKVGVVR